MGVELEGEVEITRVGTKDLGAFVAGRGYLSAGGLGMGFGAVGSMSMMGRKPI